MPERAAAPGAVARAVRAELGAARARTLALVAPLSDEELRAQPCDALGPIAWDLGHVASFEELWLVRRIAGDDGACELEPRFDPQLAPRPERRGLALPGRAELLARLADVRARALATLAARGPDPGDPLRRAGFVWRMVASHESQHQETLLQGIARHRRAPYPAPRRAARPAPRPVDDAERATVGAGEFEAGAGPAGFAYDNERPRRTVRVPGFALDRFPVTNRRYARFVAAGGYARRELWTADGWAWREREGAGAPLGWRRGEGGAWRVRRFGSTAPLELAAPVQHVSAHEADAFARWAGGRLPTELEWEKAASWDPAARRPRRHPWGDAPPTAAHANLDAARLGPVAVGSFPAGASAYGVEQLLGDVYQWTASELDGYPGFAPFPYADYSAPFLARGLRVLRGASWAARPCLARCTYRNWDRPERRELFAGLRVAWDVDAPPGDAPGEPAA